MTPENFCYWLQGCLEISNPRSLNELETQIVKDHLSLVFKKETPNRLPSSNINTDPSKFLFHTRTINGVPNKNGDIFTPESVCVNPDKSLPLYTCGKFNPSDGVQFLPQSYIIGNSKFVRVADTNEFKLDESYYTPPASC